jgi:hypothetical protein
MRASEAPATGWYPDPQNRTRLRWWDGTDWTDIRRAPPSDAELQRSAITLPGTGLTAGQTMEEMRAAAGAAGRVDAQQIITEVRNVARAEVDRAAEEFTHRAQTAVRSVTPLIETYATKFTRAVKWAAILAIVLVVAWFTFQTIAQASFFEWIGDRIDNITDDENGASSIGSAFGIHR